MMIRMMRKTTKKQQVLIITSDAAKMLDLNKEFSLIAAQLGLIEYLHYAAAKSDLYRDHQGKTYSGAGWKKCGRCNSTAVFMICSMVIFSDIKAPIILARDSPQHYGCYDYVLLECGFNSLSSLIIVIILPALHYIRDPVAVEIIGHTHEGCFAHVRSSVYVFMGINAAAESCLLHIIGKCLPDADAFFHVLYVKILHGLVRGVTVKCSGSGNFLPERPCQGYVGNAV